MSVLPALAPKLRPLLGIDLRTLALFRVALALLLLVDGIQRAADLEAFYTDFGVLPRAAHAEFVGAAGPLWSIHLWTGSVAGQATLFVLAGLGAAALLVGWHTRLATLLSWLLLISLHTRNPLVNTGGDVVLRLLLFWSIFLPLGAHASLDARRRAGKGGEGNPVVSVASAALLLQVALIYPLAALFKLREAPWQELTFLAQAMSVEGVATPLGRQLLRWPEALPVLSWLALQLERWGVLLAFFPFWTPQLRTLAVAVFASFHLVGIGATFEIGLFPVVMAVAWIPFLPRWLWDRLGVPIPPAAPARRRGLRLAANALAAYLLACVLLHNLYTLDRPARRVWTPTPMWTTTWLLRLDQRWELWTRPMTNRYAVFAATLEDGSRVDLHRDGAPLDWDQPRRRSRNNRWWKYQLNLARRSHAPQRALYADWLVRRWNRAHPERRVASLELWLLDRPWRWPADAPLRRTRLYPAREP